MTKNTKSLLTLVPAAQDMGQGHSKNPFCDGLEGAVGSGGAGFARGGHGFSAGVQHGQGEIADGDEGPRAGADAAAVLCEGDVAPPVQPVLDAPVGAREGHEPVGSGLVRGQACHVAGDLGARPAAGLARVLDAQDLCGAGSFEIWRDLGAARSVARLDASVPLVQGLGPAEIRRWAGGPVEGGKGRRSFRRWRRAALAGSSSLRRGDALDCP